MAKLSDYERKARLAPGLFAAAPVVILVLSVGLKRYTAIAGAGGFLSAIGGTYVLAVLVARFGRAAEQALFSEWNGAPTTQLLRCTGPADPIQRDIWRGALTKLTGVRLYSEREEQSDPAAADAAITAAIGQVRYLGHAGGAPIVAAENTQYGLERNLFGIRHVARGIGLACGAGLVVGLWFPRAVNRSGDLVGLLLNGCLLVAWFVVPSAERTREAGFRYATQLLQAVVREARVRIPMTSDRDEAEAGGEG